MDDTISRQDAIGLVNDHTFYDDYDDTDKNCLIDGLQSLPSAHLDRNKGKWIEYTRVVVPEPYNKWEQAWKCDKCGFDDGFPAYNFCPHCGADMREEDDHE